MNKLLFIGPCKLFLVLALVLLFSGCQPSDYSLTNSLENPQFKTLTLTKGTVHLSFEFNSKYKIQDVTPGANIGSPLQDIASVTLAGPLNHEINDYAFISIIVSRDRPDDLFPDAKDGIEEVERRASSWQDYKLLYKGEAVINGISAYRIDYQHRNIIPNIVPPGVKGTSAQFIDVYRDVRFDAKGLNWVIQINSDTSTAEADKADFEHILQTFKVLD